MSSKKRYKREPSELIKSWVLTVHALHKISSQVIQEFHLSPINNSGYETKENLNHTNVGC